MIERRRSARVNTSLPSYLLAAQEDSYLGCTILDISDTGAKLALDHRLAVGMPVELHIPAKGQVMNAIVVWARDSELGVSFRDLYNSEETARALLRFAGHGD